MADGSPDLLYRAFVARDPAGAIEVVEKARSSGASQDDLFDALYVPALALLGEAWAAAAIDEMVFAHAAVVAEQIATFVTPSVAASDTGVTVLVGCAHGDRHAVMKNIVGASLKEAGHRVIDVGIDVRPAEYLAKAEETGSRILIVFAEMMRTARAVGGIREMLTAAGHDDVVMLVCGGPFDAEPSLARSGGANGIIRGAESALRLVAKVARERLASGNAL
jgi:methanogenic corrinoid protein MtbC1